MSIRNYIHQQGSLVTVKGVGNVFSGHRTRVARNLHRPHPMFITLTRPDGKPMYLDADDVILIEDVELLTDPTARTSIIFGPTADICYVRELPAEVCRMTEAARAE